MVYVVTINNKKYEVDVEKGQAAIVGTKEVSAPAPHAVPAAATAPQAAQQVVPQAAPQAAPQPAGVSGDEAVKAPMPGTILDVKVSAGSRVKKGDVLLILEAMKMENEIVAPRDGAVVQIPAVKGSSVSTGDILAVMQ